MRYAALLVLALAGSVPAQILAQTPAQSQGEANPASIEAGKDVYMVFCQTCHGAEARGGGPLAKIMTREPPDLTRLSARNGGRFPAELATRQIDGRDPLTGHGGQMPVFGPVFDTEFAALAAPSGQPILTSRTIVDLIHWLESIQVDG
ncbi:cytochrome c [uncultured Limimaricola sp.]|uniref:c-type cytochrome n=1 Tax=uncultured Limimaricola sp. TaxID=2211667 RepID=UPI0030F79753